MKSFSEDHVSDFYIDIGFCQILQIGKICVFAEDVQLTKVVAVIIYLIETVRPELIDLEDPYERCYEEDEDPEEGETEDSEDGENQEVGEEE